MKSLIEKVNDVYVSRVGRIELATDGAGRSLLLCHGDDVLGKNHETAELWIVLTASDGTTLISWIDESCWTIELVYSICTEPFRTFGEFAGLGLAEIGEALRLLVLPFLNGEIVYSKTDK